MKIQSLVLALSIVITTGCVTQPSTYEDRSTAEQRDIHATGAAAVEAARSNRSHNHLQPVTEEVIEYTIIEQPNGDFMIVDQNGKRDHRAEMRILQQRWQHKRDGLGDYARRSFNNQFKYRAQRSIDKKIRKLMDKWF